MHKVRLHPQRRRDAAVHLVPGQAFIPGDVEYLAQGVHVAHQAHERHGKVVAVGQRPQRQAIARDDDRAARAHPLQHLKAARRPMQRHGHAALAIGVAGPDDGDGKPLLTVGANQHILAGGL